MCGKIDFDSKINQIRSKFHDLIFCIFLRPSFGVSRCIFNWSHPDYQGIKPVEEDSTLTIAVATKGRHEYYPESSSIASMFHKDYVGTRRLFHQTRKDNRQTMKNGFWFFMGTMILDVIVMTK